MGLVALICPYCGGKIQPDGDRYTCPFCGNTVIYCQDQPRGGNQGFERGGRPSNNKCFFFRADLQGKKREYIDATELVINLDYRKRTSLADKRPMTVAIYVDGVKTQVSDVFENVGRGSIRIWFDGKYYNMDNESSVKVFLNNRISSSLETFEDKDTINVGSLSITFK